jgi:hypothetical protein
MKRGTRVNSGQYFLRTPGPPVLWETFVFGGVLDGEMQRYTSKADALAGHQRMCALVAQAARDHRSGRHE